MKYVDLHIHTSYSDGSLAPEDVVKEAQLAGLSAIAITDHDTMSGYIEAKKAGKKYGVEVIRGIEISTSACRGKMHILGYFMNPSVEPLKETLRTIRKGRWERVQKIFTKLDEIGISIDYEQELSCEAGHSYGRPHVAVLLKKYGYVNSIYEAFYRYLSLGKPAYVDKWSPGPFEVVDLIKASGGIAVLAHPGATGGDTETILPGLINRGLDGIEAIYPLHKEKLIEKYKGIVKRNDMIITGGSDFHGENSDKNLLGIFKIRYSYLEDLKNRYYNTISKDEAEVTV